MFFCWGAYKAIGLIALYKKLRINGLSTTGMVIRKQFTSSTTKSTFILTYIFNANDINILIDGYSRHVTNEYIPRSIIELISSFHATSKYDQHSIISSTEICDSTDTLTKWSAFKIGDEIEIIYDPKQPTLYCEPKCVIQENEKRKQPKARLCFHLYCLILVMLVYCLAASENNRSRNDNSYGIEFVSCILFFMTVCAASGLISSMFCVGVMIGKFVTGSKYRRSEEIIDKKNDGGYQMIDELDII